MDGLLSDTLAVVRAAGDLVMAHFRTALTVDDKGGAEPNPVTVADREADALLHARLPSLLPGSAWLSEETEDSTERLRREWVWIVDPIDGTQEFVDGIPEFAISVALCRAGRPQLGVLLNPAVARCFVAVSGRGAWDGEGRPLTASRRRELDGATLLASANETRRGEFDALRAGFVLRDVGSTAWKLGLLAAGEGDAYVTRRPRHEWDIAAGVVIATEAGATVTDGAGRPFEFNQRAPRVEGIVAAAPSLHGPLRSRIEALGRRPARG
jgi:myo-inositol-1(or 4)-monophosphatase